MQFASLLVGLAFATALSVSARAAEADIARCTDTTSYPKPSDRVVMCTEALKTPGISIETRIALLRGRGHAYYDNGNSAKAITDHTEIIRLRADDAEAYKDRGWVKWADRKYDAAIKDLNQAIKLKPDYAEAYDTRASSYLITKRYALSIADWGMVIKLRPADKLGYDLRCRTRAVGNMELAEALDDCTKSLQMNNSYATLETRALVHFRRGEMAEAIADANAALAITTVAYGARYIMGVAKLKSGDTTGGNADIATAKSLEPNVAKEYAPLGVAP